MFIFDELVRSFADDRELEAERIATRAAIGASPGGVRDWAAAALIRAGLWLGGAGAGDAVRALHLKQGGLAGPEADMPRS